MDKDFYTYTYMYFLYIYINIRQKLPKQTLGREAIYKLLSPTWKKQKDPIPAMGKLYEYIALYCWFDLCSLILPHIYFLKEWKLLGKTIWKNLQQELHWICFLILFWGLCSSSSCLCFTSLSLDGRVNSPDFCCGFPGWRRRALASLYHRFFSVFFFSFLNCH